MTQPTIQETCDLLRSQNQALTRPRVLLFVEDDRCTRMVFEQLTSHHNCRVDFAVCGVSGETKVLANRYDLIFFDLHLPGMDGVEIFRNLHDADPFHPPVVFFTGYVDDKAVSRAAEIGFCVWVKKPVAYTQPFFDSLLAAFGIRTKKELGIPETEENSTPMVEVAPAVDSGVRVACCGSRRITTDLVYRHGIFADA